MTAPTHAVFGILWAAMAGTGQLNAVACALGALLPEQKGIICIIRKELRYNLREVAELVGCSHSNLSRIELNQHSPNADLLGRIAGILDTSLDYFFEKEKAEKPKE